MSNLVKFAKAELRAAGMFDADADYGGEIAPCVVAMMETFAAYDHSGGSAAMTLAVFMRLAQFQPISPLTGEDEEWNDISAEHGGAPLWQNRRCSTVFRDKRYAWDISDREKPVTFPYTPYTVK